MPVCTPVTAAREMAALPGVEPGVEWVEGLVLPKMTKVNSNLRHDETSSSRVVIDLRIFLIMLL